jgi:hypothetical protein
VKEDIAPCLVDPPTATKSKEHPAATEPQYYDDTYFDSDDEEKAQPASNDPQGSTTSGLHQLCLSVVSYQRNPNYVGASEATRHKSDKKKVMSNDELFYDPEMDDDDDKWVQRQRKVHLKLGQLVVVFYFPEGYRLSWLILVPSPQRNCFLHDAHVSPKPLGTQCCFDYDHCCASDCDDHGMHRVVAGCRYDGSTIEGKGGSSPECCARCGP